MLTIKSLEKFYSLFETVIVFQDIKDKARFNSYKINSERSVPPDLTKNRCRLDINSREIRCVKLNLTIVAKY